MPPCLENLQKVTLRNLVNRLMNNGDFQKSDSVTRPAAVCRWPSFREGFLAPWDGLAFMCRHRGLWKYGVAPIILNVLITGVVLVAYSPLGSVSAATLLT